MLKRFLIYKTLKILCDRLGLRADDLWIVSSVRGPIPFRQTRNLVITIIKSNNLNSLMPAFQSILTDAGMGTSRKLPLNGQAYCIMQTA